jgi:hypothetical protein
MELILIQLMDDLAIVELTAKELQSPPAKTEILRKIADLQRCIESYASSVLDVQK